MKIYNPNCPICGIELTYDERLNEEEFDLVTRNEMDYAKEVCAGHCPKCKKHYIWNALYAFSYNEELESEDEE